MLWAETLMLGLQAFCCVEACLRSMWWKSLYWCGAFILTLAIVKGLRS